MIFPLRIIESKYPVMKKFLRIFGIVLIAILAALFLLPVFFKGKILAFVKKEMNSSLNAKADFADVDISFFRSFPRLAVAIEKLQIVGDGTFARDTLISAKKIDIAVNTLSLFDPSDIKVYSIELDEPRIHAIADKQGRVNWDIMKPSEEKEAATDSSAAFNLDLHHYAINNGTIIYDDRLGDMFLQIEGLNHEGRGDIGADLFTLSTKTKTESVYFNYGGVPYLNNTAVFLDGDFNINTKSSEYKFDKTKLSLNGLSVTSDGVFSIVNDSTYAMDIKFDAPEADFKSILSLIPALYKNDFKSLKTSGTALFSGFVKGKYSPQDIPAYNVKLQVKDGFFQYPDLPGSVKNVNIVLNVDNPDGITDHTVLDLSQGHLEMDNTPFDFKVLLKNPLTRQSIDAAVKGRLDLSQVSRFVKLGADTKLSGILNADVTAKGDVAVISQQKPGEFSAKGFLDIDKLYYASDSFPQPIQNTSAKILIDNPDGIADHTVIKIPAAHVEVGKDKADITLELRNPATDPVFNGTAKGGFNLANVKQFYNFEPGTSLSGDLSGNISFNGRKSFIDKEQYDKVNLAGTITGRTIRYITGEYKDGADISDVNLTFNPSRVVINEVKGSFEKTDFTASGSFDNVIGYALKDEPLAGTLKLNAVTIDLNKWMGTTSSSDSAGTSSAPFAVPANIRFNMDATANKMIYDKVEYNNVNASLLIADERVELKNVSMNGLDGTIGITGLYSTKDNPLKPVIGLSYTVKNIDVQKTFAAFNTVRALMPVGKFISGKLSSQLKLNGSLDKDMSPVLASLTGSGDLLILEGLLSKFAPLEKMGDVLNIKELNNISLRDVKTYFAVNNGKVLVKPFNVKVKDINLEIGGMHGLDQSLDYVVNVNAPAALIGDKGLTLANSLAKEASNRGIPMKIEDNIQFHVGVGGTITDPQIKVDLRETATSLATELKKQTQDFVKAAVDSSKKAAEDTLNSVKNALINEAKDELAKQLLGTKDTTGDKSNSVTDSKKRLEESGKGLIKNLLKKKKPADSTN
jgi:hypothetical protein